MTDNTEEILERIFDVIAKELGNRLAGDAKFIKAIANSPWIQEVIADVNLADNLNEMIDKKIDKSLADIGELIDNKVTEALEGLELGADNITDFESTVDNIIDDKVGGLMSEDAVDDKISDALGNYEVEADNVSGLDDLVEEKIGDIDKAVAEYIDNNSDTIVEIIKNSSEVAQAIAEQLKVTT